MHQMPLGTLLEAKGPVFSFLLYFLFSFIPLKLINEKDNDKDTYKENNEFHVIRFFSLTSIYLPLFTLVLKVLLILF